MSTMPATPDTRYAVEIVERKTMEVAERMEDHSHRSAERIADGARINLNRAEYFVRIVPMEKAK